MPFKKKDKKAPEVKVEASTTPVIESSKVLAFYIDKTKGLWRLNLVELQDDKVVSRKSIECENRSHALEKFKIRFAETYFIGR